MKISHIVPVDLLDLIEDRDFYMCLANVACKNDEYLNFYKKQVERGAFVLLDNGAAEQDQMTLDIMWDVMCKLNPSEVILNDSLCNKDETLEKSKQSLEFYKKKGYKGQFMFVPQGKNMKEWIECYNEMDLTDISTIGVSKFITSNWTDGNTRYLCCKYLSQQERILPVHLLGCHTSIYEIRSINDDFSFIRSNDTAMAFIYAQKNKTITSGDRPEGTIDFINSHFNTNQLRHLENNIIKFDNLIKHIKTTR